MFVHEPKCTPTEPRTGCYSRCICIMTVGCVMHQIRRYCGQTFKIDVRSGNFERAVYNEWLAVLCKYDSVLLLLYRAILTHLTCTHTFAILEGHILII